MKKKLLILFLSCLAAFLLASCNEVLSVVTVDKNGEKVVSNYVSLISDKVYDESVSFKSWNDIELLSKEQSIAMDNLLFKIENKKENIVVLGDKDAAVELSFFEGGYKYTLFVSADSLSESMNSLSKSMNDF